MFIINKGNENTEESNGITYIIYSYVILHNE